MEETIVRPKNSKKEKQDSKPKRLPPYNVILLNDDDHTVEYVVDLCQKVFGYPFVRCIQKRFARDSAAAMVKAVRSEATK